MLTAIRRASTRRYGAAVRRVVERTILVPTVRDARERSYRRLVARHQPHLPSLPAEWHAVCEDLHRGGVAVSALDRLGLAGSRSMVDSACALIDEHRDRLRAEAAAGSTFLMVPPDAVASSHEIVRFGLSEPLLDLAESYLGVPVAYDGVTIQYTVADGRAVSSRSWHRDREDRRMVKLCVYLNDVGADDGPFELVSDPHFGEGDGYHLSVEQEALLDTPGGPRVTRCDGPAGTAVFADTAAYFHRGRPTLRRDRAAVFFSYFARVPARPYFCDRSGIPAARVRTLVADLSPRQQTVAGWAAALPLPWRLIPAAPL